MAEEKPYEVLFIDETRVTYDSLPTPNDVNGSEILLKESTGSRVVKKDNFVIKFGVHVHSIEAFNMLYVEKSTSVPVPKVYAVYQRQSEKSLRLSTYIVMQYIPGTTLLNRWGDLTETLKTSIARTLRVYFDELRQLQSPDYFGNIDGGPPLDELFSYTRGAHEVQTSFTTEDDLIKCVIRMYFLDTGDRMAYRTRYYQQVLPTVLNSNAPSVFTHNDFQRKNIIIQPDGTPVIIDWEFASWFPRYWEYSTAIWANGGWNDDWHEYVRIALDEYPNQSLWLSSMKREMWS